MFESRCSLYLNANFTSLDFVAYFQDCKYMLRASSIPVACSISWIFQTMRVALFDITFKSNQKLSSRVMNNILLAWMYLSLYYFINIKLCIRLFNKRENYFLRLLETSYKVRRKQYNAVLIENTNIKCSEDKDKPK